MKRAVVLAIDQGTTGTRAILYDHSGKSLGSAYQEFRQHYPHPGWVEHNPQEIWNSCLSVIRRALSSAKLPSQAIVAIGITNQRETTILWDKSSGRPVYPAIVWQDRRTADLCSQLEKKGYSPLFRNRTGLVLDPYFSGSKIEWLLHHHPALRQRIRNGKILFGTIDTWLLWNLTRGKSHKTDFTNASRTLLCNIKTRKWDPDLLKCFKIPENLLPEILNSAAIFGYTEKQGPLHSGIPIYAMVGDQQAALYGQACYQKGDSKNTYGTGSFVMTHLGTKLQKIPFGLLATLACQKDGSPAFALEGSIFIAGAAVQWLRDGLKLFSHSGESEPMARSVQNNAGVTVIPAFVGLGSPYWNPHARGVITGLTRGVKREHIVRATLEAIAHQSADVIDRMKECTSSRIKVLKVDGGATRNNFLMQFQADILNIPVCVSAVSESTAWGAAKLAAMKSGFWPSLDAIDRRTRYKIFRPHMTESLRTSLRNHWQSQISNLLANSR